MSRERNSSHSHRQRRDKDCYEYESDELEYDHYEEYEEEPLRRRVSQRQPPSHSSSPPTKRSSYPPSSRKSYLRAPHPQPRQRSIWPILFTGCAIGVVLVVLVAAIIVVASIYSLQRGKLSIPVITPPSRTISTQEMQTVPLTAVSQIIVCDVIGNVVLKADPQASKPTVAITKKVQANSQTEADQEFQRIDVAVQPPGTLTHPLSCARLQATATPDNAVSTPTGGSTSLSPAGDTNSTLTVNVTFPSMPSTASVDLTITIPPSALPTSGPSTIVNIESAGNISVDGISGVLNIKGDSGNPHNDNNIKVTHAALADGSKLSTTGAIIFNGYLAKALDPNKTALYILQGEKQIDVTLPSDTNLILEAYAVNGSVKSQFPLQQDLLQKDRDMTSYHGPLNSSAGSPVNAQLTLHVGIGDVNINKLQVPEVQSRLL